MKNFTHLKKRIKKNEGYRNKKYFDVLGFSTIGYGHLIKKNQKYLLKKKYTKIFLNKLFEIDFDKAFKDYLKFYSDKKHNKNIKEFYIEMIFQLGIFNQRKFAKMNKYIDKNKLFMAAFEMKNSLWYKQTPNRVDFLINILLKKKYEKKNEEAFLKSIIGTSPIKKKNNVEKKPRNKELFIKNNFVKEANKKIQNNSLVGKNIKSYFVLEKSSINKKLKKGKIPIDRKIDFHGLSVLDAEELFLRTITHCYDKNLRCILFVTGKGIFKKSAINSEDVKLYYGKIRESFFIWIKKNEMQKYILSVEQASIEHGADGAFFVYLRKKS